MNAIVTYNVPHMVEPWGMLIVVHFFLSGLAGGSFITSAAASLFNEERYKKNGDSCFLSGIACHTHRRTHTHCGPRQARTLLYAPLSRQHDSSADMGDLVSHWTKFVFGSKYHAKDGKPGCKGFKGYHPRLRICLCAGSMHIYRSCP